MSQAIITFDIIEYLPSDFKFDNFSFIVSSENRDFEQEISYMNKNQITHKANLNKRELKYSIKATRSSSLIGISDLIIPSHVLSKKESTFDKTCSITMTDSIKRVLFGNTSPSNFLKLNFHLTLQYKERETINRHSNSGKKIRTADKSDILGHGGDNQSQKESGPNSVIFSQRNPVGNKKIGNIKKQRSNSKPKSIKSQGVRPKNQSYTYNKFKEVGDLTNDEDKKNKSKNESLIDQELNKEVKEIDPKLTNFMSEFNSKYPLEKLNSYSDVNEMVENTKNIVEELLNYQLKIYDAFSQTFSTKNKFKKLMVEYNNKLRNVKKEMNKLDEENDLYEIKQEINEKNNFNDIKDLLPLKENEMDTYKELCGAYLDGGSNNKEGDENSKKIDEQKNNEEKTQNLLLKVLTHNINKYGPVNTLFTQTNSTEPERLNIKRLADKYNLPLNSPNEEAENNENKNEEQNQNAENADANEENKEEEKTVENNNDNNVSSKPQNILDQKITKWEYVLTEKPDKIDKKLENYLKYFYSKRTFPKIFFKKTSTNNYEYGTQKVMIKIEGDTIRVRYVGGYLLIDKFIELNSATEEKKLKKQSEKNNNNKKGISSTRKK